MEKIVRWCLCFSIGFEVLAIGLVAVGKVTLPLLPWLVLGLILLVGAVATLYWVNLHWARMGTAERICAGIVAAAPVIPVAVAIAFAAIIVIFIAVAAVVVIAIGLYALANGGAGGGGGWGASYNSNATREVTDRYGNRIGSVDPNNGEIRDQYGNRLGWKNPQTGEVTDAYGNRVGSVDPNSGEVRDQYGNRL